MKRLVGSANVGYAPTERISISAAYSSFKTNTVIRSQFVSINQLTPYDNLDTLNYTQLSNSANANLNYIFKSKETYRQSVNLNVAFQKASDEQGGVEQSSGSKFYNLNSNYNINFIPRNLGVSLAINYNQNEMSTMITNTMGPTLGFQKSFLDKKLRANISSSYNNSYANRVLASTVISLRIGGNYSVKKSHSFNASLVVLNRNNKRTAGAQATTEYTGNLSYSYSF